RVVRVVVGHRALLPFVHNLGVDHVLLGAGAVLGGSAVGAGAVLGPRRCGLLLGALVHRLGDLVERRLQRLGLGVDLSGVARGQRLADGLDRSLDLLLGGAVDLLVELLELTLGLVGRVLAVVAGLGQLALALVVLGVR